MNRARGKYRVQRERGKRKRREREEDKVEIVSRNIRDELRNTTKVGKIEIKRPSQKERVRKRERKLQRKTEERK